MGSTRPAALSHFSGSDYKFYNHIWSTLGDPLRWSNLPSRRDHQRARASAIESLPAETLRQILWYLEPQDRKALRLASPLLEPHAAAVIHRVVVLSPLDEDLYNFLCVANTPRLAGEVREVEWHEIYADGAALSEMADDTLQTFFDEREDLPQYGDIANQVYDLPQYGDIAKQANRPHLGDIAKQDAVDSIFWLPPSKSRDPTFLAKDYIKTIWLNINAGLSKMPGITGLTYKFKDAEYIIGTQYPLTVGHFHTHTRTPRFVGGYCGVVGIMLQSLLHTDSRLSKLVWAGHRGLADFAEVMSFMSMKPLTTSNLTTLHIDLQVAPCHSTALSNPSDPSLPERYSQLRSLIAGAAETLRELRFQSGQAYHKNLGLPISNLLGNDNGEAVILPRLRVFQLVDVRLGSKTFPVLADFIQRHRNTLLHLFFEECEVSRRCLSRIAEIKGMKLESFIIVVRDWNHGRWISQKRLLECINSGDVAPLALSSTQNYTHFAYIDFHDGNLLPTRCIDFDTPEEEDLVVSGNPEDSEDDDDTSSVDSLDFPRLDSTRWSAGCMEEMWEHTLFYWIAGPEDHPDVSHKTRVWRFIARDGAIAYGDNPLEFFEDWDADLGDVAQPTPYGLRLSRVFEKGPRDDWATRVRLSNIIPPGAQEYTLEDYEIDTSVRSIMY